MPQQALGRHEDQRLAIVTTQLAAQRVEVLGRRRQVADLDVVLGAELKKALQAGARVLGPLALLAVRKQHHQSARAVPLLLRARDELVDDDLCGVCEVPELRLPDRQPARVGGAVSVLEAEHRRLGEHGVADDKAAVPLRERLQWHVALAVFGVMQHGMPMAERAPFRVLACEANGDAVEEQGADGQGLRRAPVDATRLAQALYALLHQAPHLGVGVEALRMAEQGLSDERDRVAGDRSLSVLEILRELRLRPQPVMALRALELDPDEAVVHGTLEALLLHLLEFLQLVPAQHLLPDQALRADRARAWMRFDLLVQDGLREGGIVALVVPMPAVADEVDDDVLLETLPEGDRELGRVHAGLGIVGVHVEDGRLNDLGHVTRVFG